LIPISNEMLYYNGQRVKDSFDIDYKSALASDNIISSSFVNDKRITSGCVGYESFSYVPNRKYVLPIVHKMYSEF